jgi:hypothetical protein
MKKWLLRQLQSRGYGVHSPFAFGLITGVIRCPHAFYAFSDIRKALPQPNAVTGFNHLSFRLVHHFQAENILEINPGNGINTRFLTAPSPRVRCKTEASPGERYDAIFVNVDKNPLPDIPSLLSLSNPNAFWVIHPVNKGAGKQFWTEIVQEEKARATFDAKETGIVFLRPDLHKKNYLV